MKTATVNESPMSIEEINYLSRGSAALAQGRYQTKEDIDKLREEVLNYNFDK
jgi:hypothetical protein